MKEPDSVERERCMTLRCRSKRGEHLSDEDYAFCTEMWKKYQEWYKATEVDVFNRTVPFGSNVSKPKSDGEE